MKEKIRVKVKKYERYKLENRKEKNQVRKLRKYLKANPNNQQMQVLLEQLETKGY